MSFANRLVIFARQPRLGTGKRRLARDIGATAALNFQRLMLAQTLRRLARDRRWITYIAITPDRARPGPGRTSVLAQGGGDLGARMARAAHQLPPGPVVIVGCDIPGLTATRVADAFRKLGACDAVFGPATDGGYWLVGLRRRPRFIDPFANVRWSTRHALADTVANLGHHRVMMAATLADVDDGAAYAAWLRTGSPSAP